MRFQSIYATVEALQRKERSKAVGPHYIKGVQSLLWICPLERGRSYDDHH